MKRLSAGFALMVAAGLFAAQQDGPEKTKTPDKAKAPAVPAIRFNPTPSAVIAATDDTLAIAASSDGKRIATVGGSFNPSTGFISVLEAESKKELLAIR